MDFSTRGDNQLDLVITSYPSHKVRCKPLPPIGLKSDHDVFLLDTSLQAVRAKPVKRTIYLWKKADTKGITTTLSNYSKAFRAEAFSSVEDMWQNLKTAITTTMEKFVPSKMSSSKHTHPWINTKIRRATRRKQRAHRKAKSTKQKKGLGSLQENPDISPKGNQTRPQEVYGRYCQLRHETESKTVLVIYKE